MEKDCLLIIGAEENIEKVYREFTPKKGYLIISRTDGIVLLAKEDYIDFFDEATIRTITNIAKKYIQEGTNFVDLTDVINKMIATPMKKDMLIWWIRQAITKTIINKEKKTH